jgi:putative addiction module antidote
MLLKLRAVGNSLGVIVPSHVLRSLGIGEGDEISITVDAYKGVDPVRVSVVEQEDESSDARLRRVREGRSHQDEK